MNEFEEIQVLWGLIKIKTINIGLKGIILIVSILLFVLIFIILNHSYNLKINDDSNLDKEKIFMQKF